MSVNQRSPRFGLWNSASQALSRLIPPAFRDRVRRFWDRLSLPHPSIQEVGARRQARLLASLALALLSVSVVGLITTVLVNPQRGMASRQNITLLALSLFLLVVYWLSRTRNYRLGSAIFIAFLSLIAPLSIIFGYEEGMLIQDIIYIYVPLVFVLAGALLSSGGLAITVIANVLIIAFLPLLNPAITFSQSGSVLGGIMSLGALTLIVVGFRNAVERDRLAELAAINRELDATRQSLEVRVAERTQALSTSAEVSRRLSTILDMQELVKAVVGEVQTSFGYYHAQIYLWDEAAENLLLAYGTGNAGQVMMQSGHKITRGRGLVGRAAATNQPVLVSDTSAEPAWLQNPLLPETRAEAAIPIAIGENVLGVLDVQQRSAGGLTGQDVSLLQAVANQVAIALQNARQVQQTEEILKSLSIFQRALENTTDAVFMTDLDGTITFVNPAFEKTYGYSWEEAVGQNPRIIKSGLIPQEGYQQFWQTLLNKSIVSGEITNKTKDGRLIPIEGSNIPILDDEQEIVAFLAVHRDITERQHSQAELKRQAEELGRVAEIAITVSTVLEPERLMQEVADLTKANFNLYHAHIYLLDAEGETLELAAGAGDVGRQMVAQGRRIPLDSERSLVARAARQRQGVIVNNVQAEPDFLPNPLLPDTASEMAVPLVVGDQLLGVLDAQSEQVDRFTPADIAILTTLGSQVAVALQNARQYEQARRSEQLVRTLIDNLPDAVFVKDAQSRWTLNNNAHLSMLGFQSQDQVLGKSDLDIFPIELAQKYFDDEQELLRKKQPLINYQENVIHQTTGQRLTILTSKIPILDARGNVIAMVGINHDITELERLQRETQERLTEIDSLYRAMSRQAWETFQRTSRGERSYYFDSSQPVAARPAPEQWLEETRQAIERKQPVQPPGTPSNGQPVWAAPLLLRGDPIGALAIEVDEQHPLSEDEQNLLSEMLDQIALAVESARLFEQTRATLSETETLYAIIAEMNAAQGYDDILKAMSERTTLRRADLLVLGIFDQPMSPAGPSPEWIYPVAVRGADNLEIAQKYPVGAFQVEANTLFTDQPVMLTNVSMDKRLDSVARTLFKEVFQANSMMVLPLRLADQSIGFVMGFFHEAGQITPEEMQPLVAIAGQAAIAVQSRLLLERSQARARQEQRIREVSAQVFGASDVDTIMRRAVEQIGRVLGMPAFIYLGQPGDQPSAEQT